MHVYLKYSRFFILEHRNDSVQPIENYKAFLGGLGSGVIITRQTPSEIEFETTNMDIVAASTKWFKDEYDEDLAETPHVSFQVKYAQDEKPSASEDSAADTKTTDTKTTDTKADDAKDAKPTPDETLLKKPSADSDKKTDTAGTDRIIDTDIDEVVDSVLSNDDASTNFDFRPPRRSAFGGGSDESVLKGKRKGVSEVLTDINALVGFESFKELAKEIVEVAPEIVKNQLKGIFMSRAYLFAINDGCGLTTALECFAQLLEKLELVKLDRNKVYECELKIDGKNTDEMRKNDTDGFDSDRVIKCVDISACMSNTNSLEFRQYLSDCVQANKGKIVVFRIPFVGKEVLDRVRKAINDVMFVTAVEFPPYTAQEIRMVVKKALAEHKFTATNEAYKFIDRRIAEEKRDGKFYGLQTVKKVVNEVIYYNQLRSAKLGKCDFVINKSDAKKLCSGEAHQMELGEEMLDKMLGMDKIKARLNEIFAHIEMAKNGEASMPCMHMRFIGNPGTGKTTVARIVGKMMKDRGLLRNGEFHEVHGRDFCGRYIGETAPKTAAMCREAYGSILFIDEAYSLFRGGKEDNKDFGREAIDTLIAEMENNRSDLVVIMAGYPDDIKTLMTGNAGLASRVPYEIEFPNFNREELYKIFVSMIGEKCEYEEEVKTKAKAYFDSMTDEFIGRKDFANARFVRNLIERVFAKAFTRKNIEKGKKVVLTGKDFDLAIADKEFVLDLKPKTRRLGF